MKRLFTFLPIIVFMLLLQGCSVNPATGRNQLLLLSESEANALGLEAAPALVQEYGGEVQSPELRRYVDQVGRRLASRVEPEFQDTNWNFYVLDSEVINAFALPGGHVFMSRGLMQRMESEAELAAVLGHEIGHVTGRHSNDRISRSMVVNGIASAAGAASGEGTLAQIVPLVVGAGGQGYLLSFSRSQESEADQLGMRYMVEAGYDPEGMVALLGVLVQASQGGGTPEFLSTHPDPERRRSEAREMIREFYPETQNNPRFDLFRQRFQQQAGPYLSSVLAPNQDVRLAVRGGSWCSHCEGGQESSSTNVLVPVTFDVKD